MIDAYQAISFTQTVGSLSVKNNTISQTSGDGVQFFMYQGGNAAWNIENNRFNALGGYAALIGTNATPGVHSDICVTFNNNIAYPISVFGGGTYNLSNTGNTGTFTLNPPIGNIGNFTDYTATGVVTGTCP